MSDPGSHGTTPPPPPPAAGEPSAAERHWLWPVALIVLALLLAITATGGALLVLGQQRQLRALERDLGQAQAELERTRQELAAARGEQAPVEEDPTGLGGLLDGLLDGLGAEDGLGGLEGLLEGFGADGLEGLLGGADDLTACLTAAMAPDGPVQPVPEAPAEEQIAVIAERVEDLRGLTFEEEVETRFLPGPEFEAEVRRSFDEDYPIDEALLEQQVLAALGAIPRDMDLREVYLDLISGQAAGFYRTDTREIVVRAGDPDAPLSPSEQVTLAHELEHALSDARLGLPDFEAMADDADGARAALALVEGGATLAMQQFAGRALSPTAQLQMALDPAQLQAQAQLDAFPHHLQRDLVFPYEAGLGLACALHAERGWEAIDDAYAAPPESSAQVLWPERYAAGEATRSPEPFGAAPDGFTEARTTTMGAADLLWLFEAPGGDTDAALDAARERSSAWDGGELRLLIRGEDTALGIALVQRPGTPDLCDSIATWYRAAFPDDREVSAASGERLVTEGADQDAVLTCDDGEVRLGIGPDAATARSASR